MHFSSYNLFVSDLWRLRYVAKRLFFRNLAQQYRYSSLGLMWAFAPMFFTALVLITGQGPQFVGTSVRVPQAFYAVFGIALIQTFLEGLNATRRIFSIHEDLLRRIPQSLDAIVSSVLMEIGFNMIVRLLIIFGIYVFFAVPFPSAGLLFLALLGYIGLGFLSAGLGLFIAPANALTDDIDQITMLLPWGMMAITPVFFPANPSTLLGKISNINPLSWIFDGIRAAAYNDRGSPFWSLISFVIGSILLVLGWYLCRIFRPHVVERILR